jgi:hypothetical protein
MTEETSGATNAEDEATENETPPAPPDEFEPSGSKYNNSGDDEEDEEDNDIELVDNEPDTSMKLKQGGKREKKGCAARELISSGVAAIIADEQPCPNVEAVKRKAGSCPKAMLR